MGVWDDHCPTKAQSLPLCIFSNSCPRPRNWDRRATLLPSFETQSQGQKVALAVPMVAGTVRGQVWSALRLRNVAGTRAAVIQGQQGGPSPGQDCKTESYSPKALLMWGQVIRKRRTRSKGSPVFRVSECPLTCRCLKLETTLFITSLSLTLLLRMIYF